MASSSRSSHRLSVTVPSAVYQTLLARSFNEGRSVSNLVAFLLESSLPPLSGQTRTG